MKFNKITNLLIIVFFIISVNTFNVYASFADFTDEQADKQAQEQIKEQEKEHNVTEVKSSDNYLTSLQIEGYTLTPEFDKQTLEYTVKEEVKTNEINIKATSSNEKATINGIGNVKIEENKNEYRIDVTAENGSVRTYIIKINKVNANVDASTNTQIETTEKVENEEIIAEDIQKEETNNIDNSKSNISIYIIISIAIVVVILLFILIKCKNKKRHKSKH